MMGVAQGFKIAYQHGGCLGIVKSTDEIIDESGREDR